MKHNPKLLKESVDKSLEMLQQGKLRGPHISGQFELDQVSWNNNISVSPEWDCKKPQSLD